MQKWQYSMVLDPQNPNIPSDTTVAEIELWRNGKPILPEHRLVVGSQPVVTGELHLRDDDMVIVHGFALGFTVKLTWTALEHSGGREKVVPYSNGAFCDVWTSASLSSAPSGGKTSGRPKPMKKRPIRKT